jgi:lysyl-tRNA synthetase class 2
MREATLSEDWNDLIRDRYRKVEEIREAGEIAYPNGQAVGWTAETVRKAAEGIAPEALPERAIKVDVAGRILAKRRMGKAAFLSILDRSGRIQFHLTQDGIGEVEYEKFKKRIDIGDIVWAEGTLFVTQTGELTIKVSSFRLLTKALRPLPEKWHGLSDVETRYRQRYVDLIVNEDVRELFRKRSRIISFVRNFLAEREFLEVETPMMQPIAGGATARPFVTHHNTLDMDLFLRIAPELYLKRLLVGGFERVFEINRNFRNEGISTQHNPEFTMVEFYQAYATVEELMTLTEQLFAGLAVHLFGSTRVPLQGKEIDFAPPWQRLTVRQAVAQYGNVPEERLSDPAFLRETAARLGVHVKDGTTDGKLLVELYEAVGERAIVGPTFVTEYPIEVSPLSRKNDLRPEIVDRFELIVNGREIANAFSELNDPVDQRLRFEAQLDEKARGDEEAMAMDDDYVRALEYGMPPAAGEGIGIDRLVMLFTDSPSIRDVILFPQLRKEG